MKVPVPGRWDAVPVILDPGDVLFFHGALIHGNAPNSTPDRFRRALIGHCIEGAAEQVAEFYHPALRMDGSPLELGYAEGGGVCAEWSAGDDEPVLSGTFGITRRHE